MTDTVAPRLAEIQRAAVSGDGANDVVVGGKPFPPLQNSPDITPTGMFSKVVFIKYNLYRAY